MHDPDFMRFLTLSVVACFFYSCATYQYATVDSSLPKTNDGAIYYENDSLRITWSFKGEGCPVAVSLLNKTDVALEIDWDKSVLLLDGDTLSYDPKPTAGSQGSPAVQHNIRQQQSISLISAHGNASANSEVNRGYIIGFGSAEKERLPSGAIVKTNRYTPELTPMHLKSHIFYRVPGSSKNQWVTSDFWVSKLAESSSPRDEQGMDTFFNSSKTQEGSIAAVSLVIAGVGFLLIQLLK